MALLIYRERQLNALLRLYKDHEREMCEALAKDLNKSRQESLLNEVELLRNDVKSLLMNFRTYAKIEYVCIGPTHLTIPIHFWIPTN